MGDATGLEESQRRTLASLRRVPEVAGYYLAGGGAVAVHLGHRRSNDLDLFSTGPDVEIQALAGALARLGDVEIVARTEAMLKIRLAGCAVDFVRYAYPLLEAPCPGPEGVPIAGLLDLATMKLAAIASRGIRRDFWDLHEILTRSRVTLDSALDGYLRRFGVGESDLYHVLRSLTYFEDAERDEALPAGMTPDRWDAIKSCFCTEAPNALRCRTG